MGLFGNKKKMDFLQTENEILSERISELEELCEAKDAAAMTIISDSLRHGSSMAGQEMAARKKWLKEHK